MYSLSSCVDHLDKRPSNSHIILALLGTGEAYLVDLRKEYRGQVELCEVQDESDEEGEGQASRPRCVNAISPIRQLCDALMYDVYCI